MSSMQKKMTRLFAAASTTLLVASCGYSDYPAHPAHNTHDEAYIPAWNTVISGFDDNWNGSYVFTVDYDHQKWLKKDYQFNVKITSYRNIVENSYPHRPDVLPSGAGFEGATGFAGGTFTSYWIANDTDPSVEGGLDNFDRSQPLDADGNWIEPGFVLSSDVPLQEIDAYDWDLQSSIKNASQLLGSIIENGGSINGLSLGLNAVTLNQQKFDIETFNIGFSTNGGGQKEILIKNQPAAKNLINTIIANTQDLKKVELKLHFDNGMEIAMPKGLAIMFNHKALAKFAK